MKRLDPTGERLLPEQQQGELVHAEHLARYRLAAQLAHSRRTLDAACGEGYGTAILASAGARSSIGVDLDAATIEHARARHFQPEFAIADVRELPFAAGSFDLVVCFETIEHVPDAEQTLNELRRVTAHDGLLLISTPNKHQYLVENEFHEREFFHEEFMELLRGRFEHVELLLQHNWTTSMIFPAKPAAEALDDVDYDLEFRKLTGIEPGAELYTVALCGAGALPPLRPVAVAGNRDEAHQLARRLGAAEQTAERWHRECERAQSAHREASEQLVALYDSLWWRMTKPLRWMADRMRGGGA